MILHHECKSPLPLSQFMESMSNREFQTRMAWLEDQWNHPNRTEHYLMLIAREVRAVLAKKPDEIKLQDMKLEFKKSIKKTLTKKEKLKQVKDKWLGFLGVKRQDDE